MSNELNAAELKVSVLFCCSRVLLDRAQCPSVLISNTNSSRTGPISHSSFPATVQPVRLRPGTFHLLVQVMLLQPILLCRHLCFLLSLSSSRCNNSNRCSNNSYNNNTCSSKCNNSSCYRPVFRQV